MSSVYFEETFRGMSFTNHRGANTVPWGTPYTTLQGRLLLQSIITFCWLIRNLEQNDCIAHSCHVNIIYFIYFMTIKAHSDKTLMYKVTVSSLWLYILKILLSKFQCSNCSNVILFLVERNNCTDCF